MRLHWYNPENDMALAAGIASYTPTRAAMTIRHAGALLPLWYGDNGDVVLTDIADDAWLRRVRDDFGIEMSVGHHDMTGLHPSPWGWSAYAVQYMSRHGIPVSAMPDSMAIARMRELSHRRTSAIVASMLLSLMPDMRLTAPPAECRTMAEVNDACSVYQRVYAKMPWSSSGRGVLCSADVSTERFISFCENSIRRQDSVMIEKVHDKVVDFARLFECTGGKCRELGTSVFNTDSKGAYTGNLLMPEDVRLDHIGRYFPVCTMLQVSECLRSIIENIIAPHYDGIVGVDMLVTRDGQLDAVVEINLRKTMGYVANCFADRYLANGSVAVLRSMPIRDERMMEDRYETRGGKFHAGSMLLSPPAPGFAFVIESI